jgi:hypothetical protein
MSEAERRDDSLDGPPAEVATTLFPLTRPEHRHDVAAVAELPAHLALLHQSSWLQRRVIEDQARLDRIRDETERTPFRQRAQRAELHGRYAIVSSGVLAGLERLADIERRLADLYDQAAHYEQTREWPPDHPTRDMARDDVIRYPPAPELTVSERDDMTVRPAREHDHDRSGR